MWGINECIFFVMVNTPNNKLVLIIDCFQKICDLVILLFLEIKGCLYRFSFLLKMVVCSNLRTEREAFLKGFWQGSFDKFF